MEEAEQVPQRATDTRKRGRGWGGWWGVAVGAAVLLALSQTLWVWQTWPVRELLQLPATAGTQQP